MKIGIFGNSDAVYRKKVLYDTPASILAAVFPDDQIDWFGVPYCSSERLLLILQKHTKYDLYFMFHTNYDKVYSPLWNKDSLASDLRKCSRNALFKEKYLKILESRGNDISSINDAFFDQLLVSNQVLMNRWIGALSQIRNFCKNKNTIHIYSDTDLKKRNIFSDFYHAEQVTKYLINRKKHDMNDIDFLEQPVQTGEKARESHYKKFGYLLCDEINKFKQLSS